MKTTLKKMLLVVAMISSAAVVRADAIAEAATAIDSATEGVSAETIQTQLKTAREFLAAKMETARVAASNGFDSAKDVANKAYVAAKEMADKTYASAKEAVNNVTASNAPQEPVKTTYVQKATGFVSAQAKAMKAAASKGFDSAKDAVANGCTYVAANPAKSAAAAVAAAAVIVAAKLAYDSYTDTAKAS